MLTVQEIQDMNIAMLGLGAPVEKDGEGYNKPDFARMEAIGMLSAMVTLSFEEAYVALSTLRRYENTQLKAYKDEIEETFKAYTEEFQKRYPSENEEGEDVSWKGERALERAKDGDLHNGDDYKKRQLSYLGSKDECAVVMFQEYVADVDIRPYDGRWMKSNSGKYAMKIPYKELDRFLDYVAEVGRYGYEAPQELKDDFAKYKEEKAKEPEPDLSKPMATLSPLNKQNSYGYDLYLLDMNKYAFNQKLWELKGRGLTYVDAKSSKDSVTISTNDKLLPRLIGFLKENNVDCSPVENAPKIDIKAEMNKSGNTLIDVSKLDLPFTPYPFQVEDAQTVVGKKKALLGHDMGCVSGGSIVRIRYKSGSTRDITVAELFTKIDKDPDIHIKCMVNGEFTYMPIKAVIYKGLKKTVKLSLIDVDTLGHNEYRTSITLTPDHEVLTDEGWVEAGKLNDKNCVLGEHRGDKFHSPRFCYSSKASENTMLWNASRFDVSHMIDIATFEFQKYVINRIEKSGGKMFDDFKARRYIVDNIRTDAMQGVYDIAIDSPDIHNFICNGIVVHNCGKTFISALVGMSIPEKKLVICPETLRLNWKRELEQAHKGADIKVVYSKDKDPQFGKDWTVMGYKTAVKFAGLLMDAHFDCMFVDEAHKCKAVSNFGTPKSQQAETVMTLARNMTYTYLLTGTPMPTRNKDLFNELVMLGEINDKQKYAFHKFGVKFCNGHNNGFGWDYGGSSNTEELHEILQRYMTRRLKSEVLPHLTKQRIPIVIDTPLSKDYRDVEKRLHKMEQGDTYMALAMTGRNYLSKCKVDSAIEFAETLLEADEPVVLVAEFNETLDKMMERFGDAACCIRGGMTDTAKQQAIDDFQSGRKQVCCINLIAAGVGITLTKAHNMVICDFDWTPANMTQVEDRICRTGQNEHCNIYYICHEKAILDDIFMEMITNKSANIDKVVDDAENTVDLVSMKEGGTDNAPAGAGDFIARLKARIEEDNANGNSKPVKKSKPEAKKVEADDKQYSVMQNGSVIYKTDDIKDAVSTVEAENSHLWMIGSTGDNKYSVTDNITGESVPTQEPDWKENQPYTEDAVQLSFGDMEL